MENLCSRVSAYLYIGASIQIAFSLGLHRDQLHESGTTTEREQNRRIWWTLFILDQELASRGGSPAIIDERFTKVTTPLSSEQVCISGRLVQETASCSQRLDIISWSTHSACVASYFSFPVSPQA